MNWTFSSFRRRHRLGLKHLNLFYLISHALKTVKGFRKLHRVLYEQFGIEPRSTVLSSILTVFKQILHLSRGVESYAVPSSKTV